MLISSGAIWKITRKSPTRSRRHPSHSPESALMSPSPVSPKRVSARRMPIAFSLSTALDSERADFGQMNFNAFQIREEYPREKPPRLPECPGGRARLLRCPRESLAHRPAARNMPPGKGRLWRDAPAVAVPRRSHPPEGDQSTHVGLRVSLARTVQL